MRWERTETGNAERRKNQADGRDYTPFSGDCRQLSVSDSDTIGTITASAVNKDSLLGHNRRVRRLTPVECARLQAFPDDWADYGINAKGEKYAISDTGKYQCFGNAVTTSVIVAIVTRMLEEGCLTELIQPSSTRQ